MLTAQPNTEAGRRKRHRVPRLECNEEVMEAGMRQKGRVKLRISFQVYHPRLKTWVGLQGTSILAEARSPGTVNQAVAGIERMLRGWRNGPVVESNPPSTGSPDRSGPSARRP